MSLRAERAVEAARLRGEGLFNREIAERLGISLSYAGELLSDPEGNKVKARKDSYRGTCEDCGRRTDGSNGAGAAPSLCSACFTERHNEDARQRVIDAIKLYNERYGRVPTAMDWNLAFARHKAHPDRLAEIEERRERGPYCPQSNVVGLFGTWNAAIEAAGFTPLASGEHQDPERHRLHARNRGRAVA